MATSESHPYLRSFDIKATSDSSLDATWKWVNLAYARKWVKHFRMFYMHTESATVYRTSYFADVSLNSHELTELHADTSYKVCLQVFDKNTTESSVAPRASPIDQYCANAVTFMWPIPASIGSSVGALLALGIIIFLVFLFRSYRRRRQKQKGSGARQSRIDSALDSTFDESTAFRDELTSYYEKEEDNDPDAMLLLSNTNTNSANCCAVPIVLTPAEKNVPSNQYPDRNTSSQSPQASAPKNLPVPTVSKVLSEKRMAAGQKTDKSKPIETVKLHQSRAEEDNGAESDEISEVTIPVSSELNTSDSLSLANPLVSASRSVPTGEKDSTNYNNISTIVAAERGYVDVPLNATDGYSIDMSSRPDHFNEAIVPLSVTIPQNVESESADNNTAAEKQLNRGDGSVRRVTKIYTQLVDSL